MDKKCLTLRANQIDGPILYKAFFDAQDCLYWLNATIMHDPAQLNKEPNRYQWLMANGSSASTSDYDLWHRCFGHPGKKSVEELPGKVKGVPDRITAPANSKPCDGCKFGKSKHTAFPSSESRTEHLLDLIHMDLVDYPVQSVAVAPYFLLFFVFFSPVLIATAPYTWLSHGSHAETTQSSCSAYSASFASRITRYLVTRPFWMLVHAHHLSHQSHVTRWSVRSVFSINTCPCRFS
jgi:hypothetical protein